MSNSKPSLEVVLGRLKKTLQQAVKIGVDATEAGEELIAFERQLEVRTEPMSFVKPPVGVPSVGELDAVISRIGGLLEGDLPDESLPQEFEQVTYLLWRMREAAAS